MPFKTFSLAIFSTLLSLSSFSQGHKTGFELVSFDGKYKDNSKVTLNWVTMAQKNASHFIMQRSVDGTHYADAALLFIREGLTNEETAYHYADHIKPEKTGMVYYRLKMVDADGQFSYSQPIRIYIQKQHEGMDLFYTYIKASSKDNSDKHA